MSEAELHVLKARLRGGILSKAQRGELKMPLPVGLVYDQRTGTVQGRRYQNLEPVDAAEGLAIT
jgi:DNA invertase Pin-like site-specific DNA recombinase